MDSVHTAGSGTGTLLGDDGMIGAYFSTATALDALFGVDMAAAVVAVEGDGTLGADLYAGVSQTALTAFGNQDTLFSTAIAGELDDIDQRRGVISFVPVRSFDVIRNGGMFTGAAVGQAHSQTQAFTYDGTLQEDIVAEVTHFTGDNLVREFLNALGNRPFGMISHTGHFGKDPVAYFLNTGLNASHKTDTSFFTRNGHDSLPTVMANLLIPCGPAKNGESCLIP